MADWIKLTAVLLIAIVIAAWGSLWAVMVWADRRTMAARYFSAPTEQRRRFRRQLAVLQGLLFPLLWLISRIRPFRFEDVSFVWQDIAGPRGICTADSFQQACRYQPSAGDIFVVTQMKCGTVWMQQLVYQILRRGSQDLGEQGLALGAVSPWLESRKGVPVEEAPWIGCDPKRRIIKTHLPAQWCPRSDSARYIYVTRHPVSCFASCRDFLQGGAGMFAVETDHLERWFCGDQMWFGTWPKHVIGWWNRAQTDDNVLLVRFEDMRRDLPGVAARVAQWLGVESLADDQLQAIVQHGSYAWMKRHADAFEVYPPHLLQPSPAHFVSGSDQRYQDVDPQRRQRIEDWCRAQLLAADVPWQFALGYPQQDYQPSVS